MIRRRVGRRARWAVVLGLLANVATEASAELSPLYLGQELALSIAAPAGTLPRDDVSAAVRAGTREVLAEFLSEEASEPLHAGVAIATLYLVTGHEGMEGCADVIVEVARRSPPDERTVVGSGVVHTSILPRRETIEPIEVPVPLGGVLAEPGERIAVSVQVGNRCDDLRSTKLLYDALGYASAVRFDDMPVEPPPPTTTTTTTTTSTILPPPPPPTTVPPPLDCVFLPLTGYDSIWCQLNTLRDTLADEPAEAYGGQVTLARLSRRLARARDLVATAQTGKKVRRNLRRAQRQLVGLSKLVERKQRQGRIEPDVSEDLQLLVSTAHFEIGALR